jgi:hypothetical protein
MKEACGAREETLPGESSSSSVPSPAGNPCWSPCGSLFRECRPHSERTSPPADDVGMTKIEIDTKIEDIAQMKRAKNVDLDMVINEANDDLERALCALENIILYSQQRAQVPEDRMHSTSQENVASENANKHAWKLNVLRAVPLVVRRLRLPRNLRTLPGPKEKAQADTQANQDEILSNMKVCMTQQTTMLPQGFYELFVHQGEDVLNSFYSERGFHSVTVGQVELSSDDVQFREPWSNESFTRRRSLSFSLPVSPHDVQVHAKHHCRLEGDSRFVLDILSWTTGEVCTSTRRGEEQ